MPLPDGGNTVWPPKPLHCVYDKLAAWSAWYTGNPEDLSAVYGGAQAASGDLTGFFASERGGFRGRVRSALVRWFWGTNMPAGEQRTKLHVPIAADIASMSADMLFSEPPSFTVEDAATQEVLDSYADESMHATLREAAEICSALGGVYLRIVWHADVADHPWIDAVHPDAAVPEWMYGHLTAVTFWRCLSDHGGKVIRHLERHEPGRILHGLYLGDRDSLGARIPLTEHPDTAGIAEVLDDGDEITTGVDLLTARYVPNLKPNKVWRDTPAAGHLGRSDFADVEALMDTLDERYSDWQREVRLAKARLTIPREFLESMGSGQGASWNQDRELYVPMEMGPASGADALQLFQPQIRVSEHMDTVTDLITQILRGAGYSEQSFGMAGDVAVTATEVTARERRSMLTRRRKIAYWTPELAAIIEALLAVDQAVFGAEVEPAKPAIEFADAVATDPLDMAQSLALLRQAEAASTETIVAMLHPDWEEPEIDDEVEAIHAEQAAVKPAPPVPPVVGAPEDVPADPMAGQQPPSLNGATPPSNGQPAPPGAA